MDALYSLVSSCPKVDGTKIRSLSEDIPTPGQLPWWRWPYSFSGYYRDVYPKIEFGTKNRIWYILLIGKQLPTGGCFQNRVSGGRSPHPLCSSPENLVEMGLLLLWLLQGVYPKKWDLAQKKTGFGTFYSLPDHLIFNSEAINIFPMSRCCHLQKC